MVLTGRVLTFLCRFGEHASARAAKERGASDCPAHSSSPHSGVGVLAAAAFRSCSGKRRNRGQSATLGEAVVAPLSPAFNAGSDRVGARPASGASRSLRRLFFSAAPLSLVRQARRRNGTPPQKSEPPSKRKKKKMARLALLGIGTVFRVACGCGRVNTMARAPRVSCARESPRGRGA